MLAIKKRAERNDRVLAGEMFPNSLADRSDFPPRLPLHVRSRIKDRLEVGHRGYLVSHPASMC
jgi:hypothetical protein